jgi:type I restriction enzyme, S subunit
MGAVMENFKETKYSEYKDSGVEWLGVIPSSWDLTRLGTRFEERKTKVSDKDFPPLSVTKNGTIPQLDSAAKSNDGDNRKLVKKGDFVINSRSDRKGSSGIAYQDGSVSLIYIVLEPKGIHPIYCNYLLKSYNFIEEFYRMGHGIVADLWTTRYDEMKAIMVGIPSFEEQTAIAEFLDRKTALIDQAIDIKQKQIELLKERSQILIHKAVTRGLNPDVQLKDSGVEWIGEIPEDWEVKKLRFLANCFPSNVDKHSKPNEKEVRLCNYTDVYKNDHITDDMELMMATASDEQISKFTLREGDIVITKDSETASDIAVPTFIKEELTNVVCGYHLAVIRTYQGSYSKYLFQALKTKLFNAQFEICSNGITRVGLGNSDLKNGYFLLPPVDEQIKISDFIEAGTSKIATAISFKKQEIEKLKEYKATLINSAVTGKIKVS